MSDVLLLGIGNILLGDDGLGSWFATTFPQRYHVPPNLEVIEGGTLGLELLDSIAGRRALVVVDAATTGGKSGDIVRLEGDAVPTALGHKVSSHDIALRDLLAAAMLLGCVPENVVLCGIEPAAIAPQIALSPSVRTALPALEKLVVAELARFDCVCAPIVTSAGSGEYCIPHLLTVQR